MTFHYKVFSEGKDKLLAIADASLIGKTVCNDEIEIEISSNFYGNEKCSVEEALMLARQSTIINAIGAEIIDVLLQNGFVEKDNLLHIDKTPHAQVIVSI